VFASENLSLPVLIFQFALYFLPIFAIIGIIIFFNRKQKHEITDDRYKEPVYEEDREMNEQSDRKNPTS